MLLSLPCTLLVDSIYIQFTSNNIGQQWKHIVSQWNMWKSKPKGKNRASKEAVYNIYRIENSGANSPLLQKESTKKTGHAAPNNSDNRVIRNRGRELNLFLYECFLQNRPPGRIVLSSAKRSFFLAEYSGSDRMERGGAGFCEF